MSELDDRLQNWARWARVGYKLMHAGSAEGRYRSNWRQWVPLHEIEVKVAIDPLDAWDVELAWRQCHHRHKVLLKLRYIWRAADTILAHRARVKIWQLDIHMGRALRELDGVLTRQKNRDMVTQNLNAPVRTVEAMVAADAATVV